VNLKIYQSSEDLFSFITTLDSKGRILIPAPVRRRLGSIEVVAKISRAKYGGVKV